MEVQVCNLSPSYTDDDQKNLKQLLKAFGSIVSLEDIASTYCETGRNLKSTTEILNMHSSIAGSSFSKSQENGENTNSASSGCSSNNISEDFQIGKTKPKKCSASIGTVSSVIGKDYIKPRSQSNGLNEKLKPVKINSNDFPVSEIWDEKKELPSTLQSESMDNDLEDFVCKMLGKGFQLEKSVIQDVFGQCGYDLSKGIDKLLDLSAATLEKSDDVIGIAAGNSMKNGFCPESMSHRTQSPVVDFSRRLNTDVDSGDIEDTKTKDIQQEVLEALFSAPDRVEQKTTCPVRPVRQSPYGQVVSKPLEETMIEDFTFITRKPVNNRNDAANQSSYEDLRKAVKEYWVMMKEYCKASVDAYIKKDYENAQKLQEQGNFYMRKARETDEISSQKLIEDSDEQEEFSFNLHVFEPRDAMKQMKRQLASLTAIRYLKAVVGTDGEDTKDRRRKRLITKLLEKEGIPWTEEGNGWIISIRADVIDPTKLSYANK